MATTSRIEWTEQTWNPTVGCTKISPGCANCYAEAMAHRLQAMGTNGYQKGFKLTLLPDRLTEPFKRKTPTVYFVNSMSDLFHEKVPFEYIDQIVDVIRRTPHHTYQILTKRADRMAGYFSGKSAPKNAWLGVSVENRKYGLPRIDELRKVKAHIRFLSVEPLLEDIGKINLRGIRWVIVGGESGPKARPMSKDWVEAIRDQCEAKNVAFFFKQWGGWGADGKKRAKKYNGRELNASVKALMEQMPDKVYHDDEGITFGELFATTCNESPASAGLYRAALGGLMELREVEVISADGGQRKSANRIHDTDLIVPPRQRNLIFYS